MGEWPFIFGTSVSVFSLLFFSWSRNTKHWLRTLTSIIMITNFMDLSVPHDWIIWWSRKAMINCLLWLPGLGPKNWNHWSFVPDPDGRLTMIPTIYIHTGWWFGTFGLCSHSVGNFMIRIDADIFFRGVGSTTNQWKMVDMMWFDS